MNTQAYAELLALTQLYILQEYAIGDSVSVSEEGFAYFASALSSRKEEKIVVPLSAPVAHVAPPAQPSLESKVAVKPSPQVVIEVPKKVPDAMPVLTKTFHLEPLSIPAIDTGDMRKQISSLCPGVSLVETPQEIKKSPSVVIIAFGAEGEDQVLLKTLCQAIHTQLAPAQLLLQPQVEKWEERLLKAAAKWKLIMIIETLWPKLQPHCRQEGERWWVGTTPIVIIASSAYYAAEPARKRELWSQLKLHL